MLGDLVGQETPLQILQRAIYHHRLPHALLFSGPPNVGKTTAAVQLAKVLNCETHTTFSTAESVDCCDVCPTCQALERGNHPDFLLLQPTQSIKLKEERPKARKLPARGSKAQKPDSAAEADEEDSEGGGADALRGVEGAQILTEQVERLIAHTSLKGMQARRKVYVITRAETMNREAENRLLKTLEEPPPGTLLILTTDNLSGLLPTTISRCQLLTFRPIPAPVAEGHLQARFPEIEAAVRRSLVALSGGRLGWAVDMLRHPEVLTLRGRLLDLCVSLPERPLVYSLRLAEELLQLAEDWWLATADPEVAEKALKASPDRVLRTRLTEILNVLLSWHRDLALVSSDPGSTLVINHDRLPELQRLAPRYQPASCQRVCSHLEQLRAQLRQNANLRLAAEVLALRLLSASS
jgi:DNA polymerase-3 subunit delta'